MTTAALAPTRSRLLLRLALLPSVVAALICAVVGGLLEGGPGLLGAAAGGTLVIAFFWFGQTVLQLVRTLEPGYFFLFAMLTYLLQVVALLATFASFRRNPQWSEHVSTTSLGLSIVACTAVWSVGLVVAATKERIPLYDLSKPR